MRILHVDPERGWGGGEVQVLGLLRELVAGGHRVRLAADPDGPLARAGGEAGIDVVPLRIRNHLDLAAGLRLRRLAADADVIHFHTARAHALAPLLRRPGLRRVVTRRMDYVPRGGPYARFLYNRAVDVVIAISEGVRRALRTAGVGAEQIRVVPSGVDVAGLAAPADAAAARRLEWGIAPTAVVVMVLGGLETRKGHRILLDAARHVPGEVRYVFCGTGSQEGALRAHASALGDRVHFVGFRRDVACCLAASDVVALPSLQEGLGVAALEAMAAGRPLVASAVGGLPEVVFHGSNGLLVPPGDPDALAEALSTLVASATLRARMGGAGYALVRDRFSLARMAQGTLACYEGTT